MALLERRNRRGLKIGDQIRFELEQKEWPAIPEVLEGADAGKAHAQQIFVEVWNYAKDQSMVFIRRIVIVCQGGTELEYENPFSMRGFLFSSGVPVHLHEIPQLAALLIDIAGLKADPRLVSVNNMQALFKVEKI